MKALRLFTLVGLFLTLVAGGALADKIKLFDGPGTTGGGEFYAYTYDSSNNLTGSFITFCLEKNEYINYDTWYTYTTSTAAIQGGVGGGSPDPLSSETAYLYYHFAKGDLSNYNYADASKRVASANSLQYAIWYLEDEIAYPSQDLQAKQWIAEAEAIAHGGALYGVYVLNLKDAAGKDCQSQLGVPEPRTVFMLGLGLLGAIGLVARNRKLGQS